MGDSLGDPYGAVEGNYPCAFVGGDGHDAGGGEDELIAVVEVQGDVVARRVVVHEGDDRSAAAGQGVEFGDLSLSRHSLTQYRISATRGKGLW